MSYKICRKGHIFHGISHYFKTDRQGCMVYLLSRSTSPSAVGRTLKVTWVGSELLHTQVYLMLDSSLISNLADGVRVTLTFMNNNDRTKML